MYRSGLVDTLAIHANTKGFGLTSLSGVTHGFMPPQLKNKTKFLFQYAAFISILCMLYSNFRHFRFNSIRLQILLKRELYW